MSGVSLVPDEIIINKIYLLREQKVMLDRDIAELYGVKTIRLREQVKRNIERFPERFMFKLTKNEVEDMVSQNAIPSKKHLGGHLPYVFTEHGVLQLANVLKSEQAIQMSIRIIDLFVRLREMILTNKEILLQLEKMEKQVIDNSKSIKLIFTALKKLLDPERPERKKIGYKLDKGE